MSLKDISPNQKTYEKCLYEIYNNGLELQYVPEELKDYNICRLAVEVNGHALQYIPEYLRNDDIYILAIMQNATALKHMSPDNITDNLVKIDKEGDQYYFEIGNDITTDLAEAVAIMMMKYKNNGKFFNVYLDYFKSFFHILTILKMKYIKK